MGKTIYSPYKTIYIPDESLWERVVKKADRPEIDRSVSQLVRRFFELWLDGKIDLYSEWREEDNGRS